MTLKPEITKTYFSHSQIYLSIKGVLITLASRYMHNNLPTQLQLLLSNFNQFKTALKDFLE
jgi:hypothetical protein